MFLGACWLRTRSTACLPPKRSANLNRRMSTEHSTEKIMKNTPVVRHLVHQAVLHRLACILIHPVFASRGKVVALLVLVGPHSLRDPNHPQELVDIISGVADKTAEDNKHIVNVVLAEDGVC